MLHIVIDGKAVEVSENTTILLAAAQTGIVIPTLCYYGDLMPDGSCRFCTVEVAENGITRFVGACTELCREGMEIKTQSQEVVRIRRMILSLILQKHGKSCFSCERANDCIKRKRPFCNYDNNCYSCPKKEECKLRAYCIEYGVTSGACGDMRKEKPVEDLGCATYDRNRCILCRRCVRMSRQDLSDNSIVAVVGRGDDAQLRWLVNAETSAEYADTIVKCTEVCPTGALVRKEETVE